MDQQQQSLCADCVHCKCLHQTHGKNKDAPPSYTQSSNPNPTVVDIPADEPKPADEQIRPQEFKPNKYPRPPPQKPHQMCVSCLGLLFLIWCLVGGVWLFIHLANKKAGSDQNGSNAALHSASASATDVWTIPAVVVTGDAWPTMSLGFRQ
jgi:hypothetical protein